MWMYLNAIFKPCYSRNRVALGHAYEYNFMTQVELIVKMWRFGYLSALNIWNS